MRYLKIVGYFLLLSSCVSPYDLDSSQYNEAIVIQGMITDQPGPYLVTLSYASSVRNQVLATNWITNASVEISDDLGNSEILHEESDGQYYTTNTQGAIGRTYTLKVTTKEGMSYSSSPETLSPVGDFSNLHAEFQLKELDYHNQVTSPNGFNIYLDSDVLPEQENRVWWRWTGTYEILTYPELQRKVIPFGTAPDPPLCSGYIVYRGALLRVGTCSCCNCWVTEYNQIPKISDPQFVNNGTISNQLIGFVEANVRHFYDKYYLEVEQLSLSQSVYDFWNKVKIQGANSSNLFQVPPPKTTGNISPVSTNATQVIGYFAASAVKIQTLTLYREDVPYALNLIDTMAVSCISALPHSTNVKPVFW